MGTYEQCVSHLFHNSTNLQDCQNLLILHVHIGEIIPEVESYHTIYHTMLWPYHTIPFIPLPYHTIHTIPFTIPWYAYHSYHYHTIPWYGHIMPYHSYHIIAITIRHHSYHTIYHTIYHTMVWPYHTIPIIPSHSNYHTIHKDYCYGC